MTWTAAAQVKIKSRTTSILRCSAYIPSTKPCGRPVWCHPNPSPFQTFYSARPKRSLHGEELPS